MDDKSANSEFSVAVIGLAGRFPGAKSVPEFWQNLIAGKESISFFTDEELLEARVPEEFLHNPSYIRARGVVGEADYFDAGFFGYSPREAELLDPQHRIFLECSWHAMEDAGYDPLQIKGKIGVFGGAGLPSYHLEMSKYPQLHQSVSGISVVVSNEKDYLATRVAYKLNLTGTSVSVQCACSTSLVAVVLGIHSLLTHQNDLILAGGVSINFPEQQGYMYEKGSLDSPDGRCRTFDARAQGTVFSSGAGVVVLKRLSDALRDGDHIYCVIKGASSNNDGQAKASYTSPSVSGQTAVEMEALEMSGVHPETISYVEAHGTATQIGDPIEVEALTRTFRHYTEKNCFCAIGSVKTNIGHTDVASGVIALIKVALALEHQLLPASLHFETPNPYIDFETSPFYVQTKTTPWPTQANQPRRALINSFGVGGSNACVVLEEAPHSSHSRAMSPCFVFPFSAKTESALTQMTSNLLDFILKNPQVEIDKLAYTLQAGRALFEYRKAVVCTSLSELVELLKEKSHQEIVNVVSSLQDRQLVFMFPGQGNQFLNMGKQLYIQEAFFREEINRCCDVINRFPSYGYDLRKLLFADQANQSISESFNETVITQPALFIIEFAIAKWLIHLGFIPGVMLGHSIGEFVGACIADVITLEDALMVVLTRAMLTQNLPKGSMLAVFSPSDEVSNLIAHPNEIAVINSPRLTIVAGPTPDIQGLVEKLTHKKISCTLLHTSHAFHSHMMDPLILPLKETIKKIKLSPPKIRLVSTVTGTWMTDEEAQDPNYWATHARKPVLFAKAAQKILAEGDHIYVEVGPGHSLESAVKNCSDQQSISIVGLMDSTHSLSSEIKYFHLGLAKIWALGGKRELQNVNEKQKRGRISLPGYPFEKRKFSLNFADAGKSESKNKVKVFQKKKDVGHWFYLPSWKKGPLLADIKKISLDTYEETWLILGRDDEFTTQLLTYLQKAKQTVYVIKSGPAYLEHSEFEYTIDYKQAEEYIYLIEKIKKTTDKGLKVIHLWNFYPQYHALPDLKDLSDLEYSNFYSLLLLEQAFIKNNWVKDLSLTFVANNIHDIADEPVDAIKSLMIGPCRVFKNEYPQVQTRLIDVPFPKSSQEKNQLVCRLVEETLCDSDELIVAYRGISRWLPSYAPFYLTSAEQNERHPLRENGVYLITGGTGGIGLSLAKFIAEQIRARIVLMQRSPFPHMDEWDSWIRKYGQDHGVSKKIIAIQEIQALGSTVTVIAGDVSCYERMHQIIKQIHSDQGHINGLFHCAGVPAGGIISLKSLGKAAEVLKSKVTGTLILESILRDQPLDFFISASSITSILGEEGQIDYCSANAFLDAFTAYQNRKKPAIYSSINWDAWDVIGMAAEQKKLTEFLYKDPVLVKPIAGYPRRLNLLASTLNEEQYHVLLNTETDWFIYSHRLKGIPTLVGTSFFEFLLEYAREKKSSCIISDIMFISPLMFFPGLDRTLKLSIAKDGSFTYFSQASGSKDGNQEHMRGKISLVAPEDSTSIELSSLFDGLEEESEIRHLQEDDKDALLLTGTRWKSAEQVFVGDKKWVARLSLPSIYRNEIDNFVLHPALLDFATSFCLPYFVNTLYLPFSYKQIKIMHPIKHEIFSCIRLQEITEDFVCLDVDLLDLEGVLLATIKGYQLKKVKIASSLNLEKSSSSTEEKRISPSDGMEAFKRFFYLSTLPQLVICPNDFCHLLEDNQVSSKEVKTAPKNVVSNHSRPHLFTPYVAPSNEVEVSIASMWENVLGISELGVDDNFIELGGNSLAAIQVVNQLAELFKADITVGAFLEGPTIRNLADLVISQLIEQLDEEELNEMINSPS